MERSRTASDSDGTGASFRAKGPRPDEPNSVFAAPAVRPPSGGGAIRAIDETFSVNPANGTAQLSIALPLSPSRGGFAPQIALAYNSGEGNGPLGLGWTLGIGGIERRTTNRLPRYRDADDSDTFILEGAEELVPGLREAVPGAWVADERVSGARRARRYRPRVEGTFARIEKVSVPGEADHWRVTDGDNVTTVYGRTPAARIADPADPRRVFRWLPEWRYDDEGFRLA
jgi:hypothetical protein